MNNFDNSDPRLIMRIPPLEEGDRKLNKTDIVMVGDKFLDKYSLFFENKEVWHTINESGRFVVEDFFYIIRPSRNRNLKQNDH